LRSPSASILDSILIVVDVGYRVLAVYALDIRRSSCLLIVLLFRYSELSFHIKYMLASIGARRPQPLDVAQIFLSTFNKLCGMPPRYAPAPCKLTF